MTTHSSWTESYSATLSCMSEKANSTINRQTCCIEMSITKSVREYRTIILEIYSMDIWHTACSKYAHKAQYRIYTPPKIYTHTHTYTSNLRSLLYATVYATTKSGKFAYFNYTWLSVCVTWPYELPTSKFACNSFCTQSQQHTMPCVILMTCCTPSSHNVAQCNLHTSLFRLILVTL